MEITSISNSLHEAIKLNFLNNWIDIKYQFILAFMPLKMNLGMRTNNKVESFFGRMEIFFRRKKLLTYFLTILSIPSNQTK